MTEHKTARLRPRNEKMHELRHKRKAGAFDGGKRRPDVPEPTARDLGVEYGWKQPEDYDFDYLTNDEEE